MFAYLDAHWDESLPLREEIEIVARAWSQAAIVDRTDFQVSRSTRVTVSTIPAARWGADLSTVTIPQQRPSGLQADGHSQRTRADCEGDGSNLETLGYRRGCCVLHGSPVHGSQLYRRLSYAETTVASGMTGTVLRSKPQRQWPSIEQTLFGRIVADWRWRTRRPLAIVTQARNRPGVLCAYQVFTRPGLHRQGGSPHPWC